MPSTSRPLSSSAIARSVAAAVAALLVAVGLSGPARASSEPSDPATDQVVESTAAPTDPVTAPGGDPTGDPTESADPTEPTEPTDPAEPTEPTSPAEPTEDPVEETVPEEVAPEPEAAVTDDVSQDEPQQMSVMSAKTVTSPLPPGSYRMTSPQGPRCAPTINASLAHMGQDMAAPYGTPIYAIAAGTVRWARSEPTAGQWIVIEHLINGRIVTSSYSHSRNATEFVQAGDRVRVGQRIGSVASTGVSTGNHLHLEIWEGKYGTSGGGRVVNPDTWLATRGVSLRDGATSVYLPKPPTSCTYWSTSTMRLYSTSSGSTVVTTVFAGTVLKTPGAGVKRDGRIRVTLPDGTRAWAPAAQVSPKRVAAAARTPGVLNRDFTGDGFADVLAIDASGALRMYVSNGAGGWRSSSVMGRGWTGSRIIAANDATGDGKADIFSIDRAGRLYVHAGRGDGTFRARVLVGNSGWARLVHVFSPGDLNGDRKPDLVAVDAAGRMWLYSGDGRGGHRSGRTQIGAGWQNFRQVVAGGDINRDGRPDVLAVDSRGRMYAYFSNRSGRFTTREHVGSGWTNLRVTPLGRFDSDTVDDYVAIASDGALRFYRGSAKAWVYSAKELGRGWTRMQLA